MFIFRGRDRGRNQEAGVCCPDSFVRSEQSSATLAQKARGAGKFTAQLGTLLRGSKSG